MEAMKVVLIVLFVIISILLVLLVLIQNDEGGGLGGLLSGSAAFGSHSASVINKTTFVLVALFFVTAFAIARLNKAPAIKDLQPEEAVEQQLSSDSEAADWWKDVGEQPAEVPQDSISAVEEQ